MAKKPSRQPKPKKDGKGAKRAKKAGADEPYTDEELIYALGHPIRRQILRVLHASQVPRSPVELKGTLKESLSTVSYHIRVLARTRIISLQSKRQVRGATEHFYASEVSDSAWVRDLLERARKSDSDRKGSGEA